MVESNPAPLSIHIVTYAEALEVIQAIRSAVFQVEQGVDPALEFDGQDEAATHLVAYWAGTPIGTARIRFLGDRLAKIERVAVLADYRGCGIGRQIMEVAIAHLHNKGIPDIKINAQIQAQAFYERLGFRQRGDQFDEAGIPHVEMWL
ncbi:MAG: GNAT family N-acetyltransferase [Synechococcales bacterium]|nr:GNAT family N-acetyltransferase [Synechococcales bacterium]